MYTIVRAIQCGLSMPDSVPARQARLLADLFGPQLGMRFQETRHEPLTPHVVHHVDDDAPGSQQGFLTEVRFSPTMTCWMS